MSFYDRIRRFFYAAAHSEKPVPEDSGGRRPTIDQESETWNILNETAICGAAGPDTDTNSFGQEPPEDVIPTIVPAERLPEGWNWVHYDDGSGSLHSPEGKHFFAYDREPYYASGGIEYLETSKDHWTVFWGAMDDFKGYAEAAVSEKYLDQGKSLHTAEAVQSGNRPSVMAAIARIRTENIPAASPKEQDICL